MSDNTEEINWAALPPSVTVQPLTAVVGTLTAVRSQSARDIKSSLSVALRDAHLLSTASQHSAIEKRGRDVLEQGEGAFQPSSTKTQQSLVVTGKRARILSLNDKTIELSLLELCVQLPESPAATTSYYAAEKNEDKFNVVKPVAGSESQIACCCKPVNLSELTMFAEKCGSSRLYEQMCRASVGDDGSGGEAETYLHIMTAALVQPADSMYELPANSAFVYKLAYGVDMSNLSASNPVQNHVPVAEMNQQINNDYAILSTYASEHKTNASILDKLCAATHQKLRLPNMLYSVLLLGIPSSLKVTYRVVSQNKDADLFQLINVQFNFKDRSNSYKCICVQGLHIATSSQTVVACIKHFEKPSSKQDYNFFSINSFFNTLLKHGYICSSDTYSTCKSTFASAKMSVPVLGRTEAVNFKDLRDIINQSFFTSTGENTYNWKPLEDQVTEIHDNQVPVSAPILCDAVALGFRGMIMQKPYDLVSIVEFELLNWKVSDTSGVDISALMELCQKVDTELIQEEKLGPFSAVDTDKLLGQFFQQLQDDLSEKRLFGSINSYMLYILIEGKPCMSFEQFISSIEHFFWSKCMKLCKFENDEQDSSVQKYSLVYFAVCFFSTMFVTCDLLCNCKDNNEVGSVYIDAMLSNDYRSHVFPDLGPSIHAYAWDLYKKSMACKDSKLSGCKCPVYKNIHVKAFVSYFAYFGKLSQFGEGGTCEDPVEMINLAKHYLQSISSSVKEYLEIDDLRNENMNHTMFSQQLRNFEMHVQTGIVGSMFEVERT